MDDQRNLQAYYDGVLHTAALHLIDTHQAVEVDYPGEEKRDFTKSFQISCRDQDVNLGIILAIPYNFPDAFPTVTTILDLWKELNLDGSKEVVSRKSQVR